MPINRAGGLANEPGTELEAEAAHGVKAVAMVTAGHHLLSACLPAIHASLPPPSPPPPPPPSFSLLTTIGMRRMGRPVSNPVLVSPLPPVALPLHSLIRSATHRSQTSFRFAASDERRCTAGSTRRHADWSKPPATHTADPTWKCRGCGRYNRPIAPPNWGCPCRPPPAAQRQEQPSSSALPHP
jgi:hypothetical protein